MDIHYTHRDTSTGTRRIHLDTVKKHQLQNINSKADLHVCCVGVRRGH